VWAGTSGDDSVWFEESGLDQITIHTLTLNGSASASSTVVNGVTGQLVAFGRAGNDRLDASSLSTKSVQLHGDKGADTILGGSADDLLYGDPDGGEGGADSIVGGTGNDTIHGDGAEGGSDTIHDGSGDDQIYADASGGEGAGDVIYGDEGNDLIDAGIGADSIDAGSGNDVVVAGAGADTVHGGAGEDLIIADNLSSSLINNNRAGLLAVYNAWQTPAPVASRKSNIEGGAGSTLDPAHVLRPGSTVLHDSEVDVILGDADSDWFLYDLQLDVAVDYMIGIDVRTDI
jgi:Ca2+-binding RTX toxin-like protein